MVPSRKEDAQVGRAWYVFVLFAWLCAWQPPAQSQEEPAQSQEEPAQSQEEEGAAPTLRVEGALVNFNLDVWPIIQAHCLECHGPEDAKNDFRMDDSVIVMDYVEAGDVEGSSLWVDYLVTDDPDMRMPPVDHSVLSGSELATFRLWIEEGAEWSEVLPAEEKVHHAEGAATSETLAAPTGPSIPETTQERAWIFQGLFHPASVHFPIALLSVSALMVMLSFLSRKAFEPVAFHCLWIGALAAIAASVTGWSYAQYEGYGTGYSFNLNDSAIDRHRWMGIGTAIVAVMLFPMAVSVRRKGDLGMRLMWLLGSLILLAAVSFAGYQGGELTYGEDHYQKEFERLFPDYGKTESVSVKVTDTKDASSATDVPLPEVEETKTEIAADPSAEAQTEGAAEEGATVDGATADGATDDGGAEEESAADGGVTTEDTVTEDEGAEEESADSQAVDDQTDAAQNDSTEGSDSEAESADDQE